MATHNVDDLLRQVDVANLLGVSRAAVAQRIAAGRLEAVTVAGTRLVLADAAERWRQERLDRRAITAEDDA